MSPSSGSGFSRALDQVEETIIAVLLGAMTLVTFANVVARKLDSNLLWALEVSMFLFAWMVLLGASYGVKKTFHIGVDIVINSVSPAAKRVFALLAVSACLLFAGLVLIGSWNYWYPFITDRAWLETDDVPMPEVLGFVAGWFNEGEAYEKMPRFIPYSVLPLSFALLVYRFLQAFVRIWKGEQDSLIASHEAEDMLEDLAHEQSNSQTRAG